MHPVQKAAMDWEATAIEKCRNDPEFMAKGLCPNCVCHAPCLCDQDDAVHEMRRYYEAHRRIEYLTFFNNVIVHRPEPKETGSWGVEFDVLMRELYKIATKRHEEELRKRDAASEPSK